MSLGELYWGLPLSLPGKVGISVLAVVRLTMVVDVLVHSFWCDEYFLFWCIAQDGINRQKAGNLLWCFTPRYEIDVIIFWSSLVEAAYSYNEIFDIGWCCENCSGTIFCSLQLPVLI
jgi:hypothetical protein